MFNYFILAFIKTDTRIIEINESIKFFRNVTWGASIVTWSPSLTTWCPSKWIN